MAKTYVVLSDYAREAAEMLSTPAALEAQARREIAATFGRNFALKSFVRRTMRIDIRFQHADEWFVVSPLDAQTWEVETHHMDRVCPPYPIVFSDRAMAMIVNLGWRLDGMEATARWALKGAAPEDYGFCEFQVPLETVPFIGRLADDDVVEVDLDDWWRENVGA